MLGLALLVVLAIAGTDQYIKYWIVSNFELHQEKPFLQIGSLDILHLHYIENTGSAFSSFAGQTAFLLIVSILGIIAGIYILIRYGKKHPLFFWSLVMILGGAFGNLLDRIFRHGAVVDYFDIQLFSFAIFNLADCFVCVGTALLMLYIIFFMEEEHKPEQEQKNDHA